MLAADCRLHEKHRLAPDDPATTPASGPPRTAASRWRCRPADASGSALGVSWLARPAPQSPDDDRRKKAPEDAHQQRRPHRGSSATTHGLRVNEDAATRRAAPRAHAAAHRLHRCPVLRAQPRRVGLFSHNSCLRERTEPSRSYVDSRTASVAGMGQSVGRLPAPPEAGAGPTRGTRGPRRASRRRDRVRSLRPTRAHLTPIRLTTGANGDAAALVGAANDENRDGAVCRDLRRY